MSSDEVLSSVITDAGYDGKGILSRANSPQIKADLRARTKEAKEVGICGVPSYRVYRRKGNAEWTMYGDVVWGQDDLAVVEDLIAGSDRDQIATVGTEFRSSGASKL